ncbi:hypothetical protein E2605_18660 [Dysgonomonas capnocytophagoides]|uniref:Uncharacterized protein n=1 Tax=Dysgonomonas capnocytophagoides TaxID=45254 RepID=A0A4Y8KTT7_9BACT|nr:hypothetical protein [Dysgonomonas capnocytophagoides]TFD92582.1 hypothetical protein E2605_18660 [Dysgonomonas capnocytophagoides]
MKIELKVKIKILGMSKLNGVSYTRLKAVAKEINTSSHTDTVSAIQAKYGKHISEYRLVKEKEGFIWRETILDHGICGHHKTVRKAILTALRFVDIFIDEDFSYTEYPIFQTLKKYHKNRFTCKHPDFIKKRWGEECPHCGYYKPDK